MIDYNCMIGNWPFRKIRNKTLDELKRMHDKYKIESGYISSIDSVFYNDPYEGDLELFNKIKNTKYKMTLSMNLNLPYLYRDIKKANETFDYEGIRIYPSIHKYPIQGNKFNEFLHMVKENNKKLFISYRMGDIRLDHIIKQNLNSLEDIKRVFDNNYNNEIYFLNLKSYEILELKQYFINDSKIYFDISDMKHESFPLEKLDNENLNDKYVYGSFFPFYPFESTYLMYNISRGD